MPLFGHCEQWLTETRIWIQWRMKLFYLVTIILDKSMNILFHVEGYQFINFVACQYESIHSEQEGVNLNIYL